MYGIRLRASTKADKDFVNNLTRDTMRKYVELTWDKVEDREHYYFLNQFDRLKTSIIQYKGEDIGRMTVAYLSDRVILEDIHIVECFQGKGIGGSLVKQVIHKAKEKQLLLELILLKTNPVKRLYERAGFRTYREDDYRYYMKITV